MHQTSFLISWKLSSPNENLGVSYCTPCCRALAIRSDAGYQNNETGSPAPRREQGSSAGCSQLMGHRDRFLSACLQKQLATESVCHPLGCTREQPPSYGSSQPSICSLAPWTCCGAKAVPTTGAAAGEEPGVRAVTLHRNSSPHQIPHAPAA